MKHVSHLRDWRIAANMEADGGGKHFSSPYSFSMCGALHIKD